VDYHEAVTRLTKQALFQTGAVKACEHHPTIMIDRADGGAENAALYIARTWVKEEVGPLLMMADIRDSIARFLATTAKNECPECARMRNS
jgi:hypothetical protein